MSSYLRSFKFIVDTNIDADTKLSAVKQANLNKILEEATNGNNLIAVINIGLTASGIEQYDILSFICGCKTQQLTTYKEKYLAPLQKIPLLTYSCRGINDNNPESVYQPTEEYIKEKHSKDNSECYTFKLKNKAKAKGIRFLCLGRQLNVITLGHLAHFITRYPKDKYIIIFGDANGNHCGGLHDLLTAMGAVNRVLAVICSENPLKGDFKFHSRGLLWLTPSPSSILICTYTEEAERAPFKVLFK